MDARYERKAGENMYGWIMRITPILKEQSLLEMQQVLYDVAMDCYLRGSKEALKNKRIK